VWREALLAQAVLRGKTKGYRHHPQLLRFRDCSAPVGAIAEYLRAIHAESSKRGYAFEAGRVSAVQHSGLIVVTRGQLSNEWEHLMKKLTVRDPEWRRRLQEVRRPLAHPMFRIVPGGIESWERSDR
jgi:hypothetical protein